MSRPLNVFIGCESSGAVRDEFNSIGHNAVSCDLLPCFDRWDHLMADVLYCLYRWGGFWDLVILHPPCTYLAVSGLHWNDRVDGRAECTEEALKFVCKMMNAPVKRSAIENPIGCISTRVALSGGKWVIVPRIHTQVRRVYAQPDQIIQPYQFGEDASKATCLWLKGIPKLKPTSYHPPRITAEGKERWSNQTDSGQNNLPPTDNRWQIRSKTYTGIAQAMADQWSKAILNQSFVIGNQLNLF